MGKAMRLRNIFRDWWRGYSDADWEFAKWVLFERKPGSTGEVFPMTRGQFKAYRLLSLAVHGG